MIGQHPALFGLPELKLFAYRTIGELDASLPAYARERGIAHRSPGLVRAVAELEFGCQAPEALTAALAWLRQRASWSGVRVFDLLMERLHPRVAVEKSPEHVAETAALRRLTRAYPRARYIHLTRHPITTITSMHEHLRRNLPGYRGDDDGSYVIASWLATHQRIVDLAQHIPPDHWLRVAAEEVLNNPTPQLVAIATWLGVSSDPVAIDAMTHPERSPFASFAPAASGVTGGGDRAFLADPRPRKAEAMHDLRAPTGWSVERSQWAMVVDAAEQLGYSLSSPSWLRPAR